MQVTVVGLGPGPAKLVTPAAVRALHQPGARVCVRTRFHPAIDELLAEIPYESFDALYERCSSLDEVYAHMAERLLQRGDDDVVLAAPHDVVRPVPVDNVPMLPDDVVLPARGETVLAVPGDGLLGEHILERLRAAGAQVRVVPGVPLAVGALAAAGLAASDGVQAVDAGALGGSGIDLLIELNPRWPAVVTGVFNPRVSADVKLALQPVYPAEHEVLLVSHPGLADERVERMSLAALDRTTSPLDHLTHLVLPALQTYAPTGSAHVLRAIVARLRAPRIGCPWDLEQTHRSLIPYAIEEAYEVVDAIQGDDVAGLADELGDLLLQVALHAEIADQSGEFDWNDVVRALSEKLVRRHPHVFADVQVSGAADVVRNWDQLKAVERQQLDETPKSALDGVPKSLPALKRAAETARRAVKAGFEWPTRQGTLDKVREELDELLQATTLSERREELGDLLWIMAKLALDDGIDAEEALRAANEKFGRRFRRLEEIARKRGWASLNDHPIEDLQALWSEAKATVG